MYAMHTLYDIIFDLKMQIFWAFALMLIADDVNAFKNIELLRPQMSHTQALLIVWEPCGHVASSGQNWHGIAFIWFIISHLVYPGLLLFLFHEISLLRHEIREILEKFRQHFPLFFGPRKISGYTEPVTCERKTLHIFPGTPQQLLINQTHSHGTSKASSTLSQLHIHNTRMHNIHQIHISSHHKPKMGRNNINTWLANMDTWNKDTLMMQPGEIDQRTMTLRSGSITASRRSKWGRTRSTLRRSAGRVRECITSLLCPPMKSSETPPQISNHFIMLSLHAIHAPSVMIMNNGLLLAPARRWRNRSNDSTALQDNVYRNITFNKPCSIKHGILKEEKTFTCAGASKLLSLARNSSTCTQQNYKQHQQWMRNQDWNIT